MKKEKLFNAHGFSLIELLISLIIISLIAASFAPVVTKYFKHRNVTLGTSSGVLTDCSGAFSEDCKLCLAKKSCLACQKSSLSCPLGYFVDTITCKCVSCVADGNCKSCDNTVSCKTCPTDTVLEGGKCTKACPNGTYAPDNNSLSACLNCDSRCLSCSNSATNCNYQCKDKYYGANCANDCPSTCKDGKCDSYFGACTNGCASGYVGSTSCSACGAGSEVNTTTNTCKTCDSGYYSTGAANQTCSPCGANQQNNSNHTGCTNCSLIHSNCTKCSNGLCSECSGNYEARNGTCAEKAAVCNITYNGTNYTIENAVKFTGGGSTYCMTSTNMGDGAYANIPLAAGITPITSSSGACSGDKYCCWKHGGTSGSNAMPDPNPGFDYAPQGRTLCNQKAALVLCPKITSPISGMNWHLPTPSEFEHLKSVINAEASGACTTTPKAGNIQKCAGKLGLQFCENAQGHGSPYCANGYCDSVAVVNYCNPNTFWANGTQLGHHAGWNSGSFVTGYNTATYAGRSIRCILGPFY